MSPESVGIRRVNGFLVRFSPLLFSPLSSLYGKHYFFVNENLILFSPLPASSSPSLCGKYPFFLMKILLSLSLYPPASSSPSSFSLSPPSPLHRPPPPPNLFVSLSFYGKHPFLVNENLIDSVGFRSQLTGSESAGVWSDFGWHDSRSLAFAL